MKLRLGTRGSRLALAQTRSVADALAALGLDVDVIPIKTSGDHLAQVALGELDIEVVAEVEPAPSLRTQPKLKPNGIRNGK